MSENKTARRRPKKASLLARLRSAHECMVTDEYWLAGEMKEAITEIERLNAILNADTLAGVLTGRATDA
jgi:hypothetical protein